MAFCTCVASIPPNGRTKIKFFGRPLGRNELIAAICTLATQRMYNRKQISSHSQVLKDKVPPPYKEIFTFEDKARGGDDPAENSTANVIENYPFPETIYNIINYPVGTDLANAPKPQWLQDLEARGNDASPTNETSTRQYNYWNNPSEYSAGGGYYDRDAGLYGSKIKLERDARDTGVDSTYAYSYSQSHPSSRQQQGQLPPSFSIHQPPPHTLPPLGSSRDVDPHGVSLQPPNTASSLGESTSSAGRYTYGSTGQAALSARSNVWEGEHSRSPTSTNSAFEAAGSTAVSPRRSTSATVPSAWQDVKPSLLHEGLSGEHLTLPPLQEPPSSYTAPGGSGNSSTDWKSRAVYGDTKWATSAATLAAHSPSQRSGLPAMALPSIGLVASQTTSSYGATPSSAASPWSTTSGAFGVTPSWDASRTRMPTFAISSIEVMARTGDTMVSLTSESQILSSTPIPWNQVYMYRARYPFLEAVSTAPGVPVYHIDMPLALPAEYTARLALLDSVSELGLSTTLRQTPDSNTWSNDWVMTTESGYLQPRGPTRYSRTVSPLRHQPSGGYNGHSRLPELARLYEHLVRLGGATDESGSMPDALASVGAPMTMLVQRVARDGFQTQSTTTVDDDWTSAAAIIIYSFFITTDEAPRAVPVCRSVDFDAPPLPDDLTNEQLVANLFAGEQHLRSKFPYL
ncbi:hypothetical protein Q8F55_001305 [Vanrija albida]|uniref:TEA domain-containing protein n=1 Tax=Vanrija albida TaxID=181172 RepID=A0ABR3QFN9_9TREE